MAKKKVEVFKIEIEEGKKELFMALTYFIRNCLTDKIIQMYLNNYKKEEDRQAFRNEILPYIHFMRTYSSHVHMKPPFISQSSGRNQSYEYEIQKGNPFHDYKPYFTNDGFTEKINSPVGQRLIKIMMDRKELHIYFPDEKDSVEEKMDKEKFINIVLEATYESPKEVTYNPYYLSYHKYKNAAEFQDLLPPYLHQLLQYSLVFDSEIFTENLYEEVKKSDIRDITAKVFDRFYHYFSKLYNKETKSNLILRILTGFALSEIISIPKNEMQYDDSEGSKDWYSYLGDYVEGHLKHTKYYAVSNGRLTDIFHEFNNDFSKNEI